MKLHIEVEIESGKRFSVALVKGVGRIVDLIGYENKIACIKTVRDLNRAFGGEDMGLKDVKELVEMFACRNDVQALINRAEQANMFPY
jgi:hypothetical protein